MGGGGVGEITVTFVCGHRKLLGSGDEMVSVQCDCGERRVRSVLAPPPRIRAVNCEIDSPLVEKQ